ncbi:hypothetical protein FB45DRAFT_889795 [Roridomyces roridus]|uniref:Uncharacterized protein n=1 Tax=Roridomyces roridus TaxID=1738132 RepID=A0AAD7CKL6_9AGAR|nr:hypothetical protein FB45DRAFT_889795 [Roridomyces roridus]
MMSTLTIDEDVFSRILAHISDSQTVYKLLYAIPKTHDFFSVALRRLLQLPVYVDTNSSRAAAASHQVLDYLLRDSEWMAGSLRHLVCSIEHENYAPARSVAGEDEEEDNEEEQHEEDTVDEEGDGEAEPDDGAYIVVADSPEPEIVDLAALHDRLPVFFKKLRNLEALDYHGRLGLPLSPPLIEALAECDSLRTVAVDTAFLLKLQEWGEDPDSWDIEPFLSSFGPSITTLELRHVCQTMLLKLASFGDVLSTYENLSTLKMEIMEGFWDWDGRGSPNSGATGEYKFPSLRLPALRRFELVVGDLTISTARSSGTPLHLFDCTRLSELSLRVRQCNWYWFEDTIRIFGGLRPAEFAALKHLEIKDVNKYANGRLNWDHVPGTQSSQYGRAYPGLISFLYELPDLVSLWMDETVLLPTHFSSPSSFLSPEDGSNPEEIHQASLLKIILWRLESLRVGFGIMKHTDVELVLSACDPTKIRQFGFEWAWDSYERAAPLSSDLLAQLARFPVLTDVHILFPRPGTQVSGLPDPKIDDLTLQDVARIFACNGSVCRVGIGSSVVWERGTSGIIILVSDGSCAPNVAVSSFFHAGYLAKHRPDEEEEFRVYDDNSFSLRPERSEEIERLRDLLKNILD